MVSHAGSLSDNMKCMSRETLVHSKRRDNLQSYDSQGIDFTALYSKWRMQDASCRPAVPARTGSFKPTNPFFGWLALTTKPHPTLLLSQHFFVLHLARTSWDTYDGKPT